MTEGCELCEAAPITQWFHSDDTCWIAECEACFTPMVVWRQHGTEPPEGDRSHMLEQLERVAAEVLGAEGYLIDPVMRQIPDHFHAHARKRWRMP